MRLLKVDTVEQATKKLHTIIPRNWISKVKQPLASSLGYTLAKDFVAPFSIPDFTRSAVDGYAILASDSYGASEFLPGMVTCIGQTLMGETNTKTIQSGLCMYVPTGGMLPKGADAMIKIEHTSNMPDSTVLLHQPVSEKQHVISIGEDIKAGEVVVKAGEAITPYHIAVLSAYGTTNVEVYEQIKIAIVSTGEEIIQPNVSKKLGQVYDINSPGLASIALQNNMKVTGIYHCNDDLVKLNSVLESLKENHIVLVSGGSSQGQKDYTKESFDTVANPGVFTHGLAIKPGKPTILAYDETSQTLLVGLPGHPVAALLVFEVLILNFLRNHLGSTKDKVTIPCTLTANVAATEGKRTYQLVHFENRKEGRVTKPIFGKSGLITTLVEANGYIVIEANQEGIEKDTIVDVIPFL